MNDKCNDGAGGAAGVRALNVVRRGFDSMGPAVGPSRRARSSERDLHTVVCDASVDASGPTRRGHRPLGFAHVRDDAGAAVCEDRPRQTGAGARHRRSEGRSELTSGRRHSCLFRGARVDTSLVPEAGDVIVVPEARQSQLVYVVHLGGEADQLTYHTRAEATARAVAYARSAGVNALYGDSAELGFVLLGRFRKAAGPP